MGKNKKKPKEQLRAVQHTMDLLAYSWVFKAETATLLYKTLPKKLTKAGYKEIITGKDFVYAEGDIPILLAAHVDTAHKGEPESIFCDKRRGILWSPDGLGGDDRAGVAGILELIRRGHRPYVIFLDKEETGALGAKSASVSLSAPPVNYIIELDRKGSNDAVFYNCSNSDFTKYVEGFGFKKGYGSYSDISTLCPAWKIAGVNLSIGYHNAHTSSEYVVLSEWDNVISRAESMLKNPPNKVYEYVGGSAYVGYGSVGSYWDDEWDRSAMYGAGSAYSTYSYGGTYKGTNGGLSKYSVYSGKRAERSGLTVYISAARLALDYGGTMEEWKTWLNENYDLLEEESEQRLLDMVLDFLANGEHPASSTKTKQEFEEEEENPLIGDKDFDEYEGMDYMSSVKGELIPLKSSRGLWKRMFCSGRGES